MPGWYYLSFGLDLVASSVPRVKGAPLAEFSCVECVAHARLCDLTTTTLQYKYRAEKTVAMERKRMQTCAEACETRGVGNGPEWRADVWSYALVFFVAVAGDDADNDDDIDDELS